MEIIVPEMNLTKFPTGRGRLFTVRGYHLLHLRLNSHELG